jgi:hypothetical protein
MVEVPVAALPHSAGASRVVPSVARPEPRSAGPSFATREQARSSPLALSKARRSWNRDRIGLVFGFRCECGRPSCGRRVPTVAEAHRRAEDHFIVAPSHFDSGVVVRAADRFFVVALPEHTVLQSSRDAS